MAKDVAIVQAQRLSGNVGDVLTKTENGVKWQAPQGGTGAGLPDGGTVGQYLRRTEDGAGWLNASWSGTACAGLPEGGSRYEVLALNSDSEPVWSGAYMVPDGGAVDDVLAKGANGDLEWRPIDALPDDGRVAGRVLAVAQDGTLAWKEVESPVIITTDEYSLEIDPALDASSSNPVQNKAVYAAMQDRLSLQDFSDAMSGYYDAGQVDALLLGKQNELPAAETGRYLKAGQDGLEWADVSFNGTAAVLPPGGTAGQVLARTSDSYSWIDALDLPVGDVGQVLALNEYQLPEWTTLEPFPPGRQYRKVLSVDASNALEWRDISFNGTALPSGGDEDDVLARAGDGSLKWMPIPAELPSGGSPNDVLARQGAAGVAWVALSQTSPTGVVDSALDASSSNPVKNKAIYAELQNKQDKLPAGAAGRYLMKGAEGLEWAEVDAAGSALPAGGSDGWVLTRSGNDGVAWRQVPQELPSTGRTTGKVLAVANEQGALVWEDPAGDETAGSRASDGAVYELGSKLDLVHEDAAGEARIYIGKSKNLSTRLDDVPEIDFLHTKDAMLGHEYCAVFASGDIDQDDKPSADIFPWVPWPVDDGEWSSSESSLSISDPWADHPNMGEATYEYAGPALGSQTRPSTKGTGYAYMPDSAATGLFYLGEPSVDQALLYGKWRKHVSLKIDRTTHPTESSEWYGEYVWDPDSARYVCKDQHKKIMPIHHTTGEYAWVAADMSETDAFPTSTIDVEDAGHVSELGPYVDPPSLRRVVWERDVDGKYVYRTVLRDDKKYSVAVADVDPACDGGGSGGGGGGGSGAACDCADELNDIRYQLMSMQLELMELWALHDMAKLTVSYAVGPAPDGAAWAVDSDSNWYGFGAQSRLEAGAHTVRFKPVDGYLPPGNRGVTLTAGESKTIAAAYASSGMGMLRVSVGSYPDGAGWDIDSDGKWREFDVDVPVAAGEHEIGFKPVDGYLAPSSGTVTVAAGEYSGYVDWGGGGGYRVSGSGGTQPSYTDEPATVTADYAVENAAVSDVNGPYSLDEDRTGYGNTPVYKNGDYRMYRIRDDNDDYFWVIGPASGFNTQPSDAAPNLYSCYVKSTATAPPTSGWTGCTVSAYTE